MGRFDQVVIEITESTTIGTVSRATDVDRFKQLLTFGGQDLAEKNFYFLGKVLSINFRHVLIHYENDIGRGG